MTEQEKNLKTLEASYLMYEETLKNYEKQASDIKDREGNTIYSDEKISSTKELIQTMQKDIVQQYIDAGGKKEDLESLKKTKNKGLDRKHLEELMKRETSKDELREYFESLQNKSKESVSETPKEEDVIYTTYAQEDIKKKIQEQLKQESLNSNQNSSVEENKIEDNEVSDESIKNSINTDSTFNNMKQRQMYDIVKLPSKGQCYKNKKDKIKVAYLTAYDENMILSPNLYKDGTFIDYLLNTKILDSDIKPDDLVQGDRDAIVIWLRATGYGTDYPIIVTDDRTRKEFETTIDLSKVNYKKFKLKGDENGYFTFTMPNTKDVIKFRYLTQGDFKTLQKLKEQETKKINIARLRQLSSDMVEMSKDNELISADAQLKIKTLANSVIEEINKNYDEKNDFSFSHELTDRLIMQTVSVNGVKDYKFIKDYIINLNVKDAKAYREYMRDNEPGVDYNIKVERPMSLGGGSMDTFLQLDQFIFVTV